VAGQGLLAELDRGQHLPGVVMPDWRYDYRPRSDDTKKRMLRFGGGSLKPHELKNWGALLILSAVLFFVLIMGYCEVVK
jgi:hypothetical protein